MRALSQQVRRGGNCTNTLVVLAQLGHSCAWGGVLPDATATEGATADLHRHGIDLGPCQRILGGTLPSSYITLSRHSGSRTIVHYRNLPEYGFEAFSAIDLSGYDWLHFEGRNVPETRRMLEWAQVHRPGTPRSVEVEKSRPDIESLFPGADILLFSHQYARSRGFDEARPFLEAIHREAPRQTLVCAWGDQGAAGLSAGGALCASPAFPPPRVVETLAAGDVFNAGIIDALVRRKALADALRAACRLAGHKCGQEGLESLKRT